MNKDVFVLKIIRKIESAYDCSCFSYFAEHPVDHQWDCQVICMDNFEVYMEDQKLKILQRAWHKIAKQNGFRIVFAFCTLSEKKLYDLALKRNLILNV